MLALRKLGLNPAAIGWECCAALAIKSVPLGYGFVVTNPPFQNPSVE